MEGRKGVRQKSKEHQQFESVVLPQPQETLLAAQQISFLHVCVCVCVCVCGGGLGVVPPAAGRQTVKPPFEASSLG